MGDGFQRPTPRHRTRIASEDGEVQFTSAESDDRTPRDTLYKLNYEGASKIVNLFGLLTRAYLISQEPPPFKLSEGAASDEVPRARLTAYLGTIPDYAGGQKGVKLSGAVEGGPADQAGVRGGDIIVSLAGKKVEDVYDYSYAIEALKIGEEVTIEVIREGNKIPLKITPGSRD